MRINKGSFTFPCNREATMQIMSFFHDKQAATFCKLKQSIKTFLSFTLILLQKCSPAVARVATSRLLKVSSAV